jgi:flagellar biosynthesis/type III secretory pathway ATPase
MMEIDKYLLELDRATPVQVKGRVKEVIGLVVKAAVPDVWIGELCLVYSSRSKLPVKAEVVGFQGGDVLLMPLGDLQNVGPQSDVVPTREMPDRGRTAVAWPRAQWRWRTMDTRLRGRWNATNTLSTVTARSVKPAAHIHHCPLASVPSIRC